MDNIQIWVDTENAIHASKDEIEGAWKVEGPSELLFEAATAYAGGALPGDPNRVRGLSAPYIPALMSTRLLEVITFTGRHLVLHPARIRNCTVMQGLEHGEGYRIRAHCSFWGWSGELETHLVTFGCQLVNKSEVVIAEASIDLTTDTEMA